MSVAMQKRQPRRAVNAQGDHIGGQFARSERADDLAMSTFMPSSDRPYPVKKRQLTIRLASGQTDVRPLSKAPAVRVKKDPNTGFWEAETPYCNPQSGYAMEKLRGGLIGDESEIVGYYARGLVDLCNSGLVDLSDKRSVGSVQTGVATAAACLGLPGGWGRRKSNTKSQYANWLASSYGREEDHVTAHNRAVNMLYAASLLGGKFFRARPGYDMPYGPYNQKQSLQELCLRDLRLSYEEQQDSVLEQDMLIWALAFQNAAQHFLHMTSPNALLEDCNYSERRSLTPKSLTPDIVLAAAAHQASTGQIALTVGDHNKALFKRWIDASGSSHSSHVFDSSTLGQVVCKNPEMLAARLDDDWSSKIGIAYRSTVVSKSGVYIMGTISLEQRAHTENCLLSNEVHARALETPDIEFVGNDKKAKPGDRVLYRTGHQSTMAVSERHFEFIRPQLEIHEPLLHAGWRVYRGKDSKTVDQVALHPLIPKLLLAAHVMGTFESSDTTRQKAEQFITETNSHPLVATLIARSLRDATKTKDNYVNYADGEHRHSQKIAEAHQHLIRNMAQAWHDFDHDSSVYALPGGRLDPEVMLKQAQQLPMTGSVT